MTLQQLNLKLPPAVIAHWRSQAAAAGLSVRDWLLAELASPAEVPAGAVSLADRVAELEATTAALQEALVQLQARPAPGPARSPRPAPVTPPGCAVTALQEAAHDGALTTAELATAIGMKRGSLNERLRRLGGAHEGLELNGWRCTGQARSDRGGPPRWLWVPANA